MFRNGHDILRVLELTQVRPMTAGLVGVNHPWVTGRISDTESLIWKQNVVYKSTRDPRLHTLPDDDAILECTGRFMAHRVRQSAITPELPIGPRRRMPHAINYMHGSSHYNSGIILLNNLAEGFQHFTDPQFCKSLKEFVRLEQREVLIVFRDRDYKPRDFAHFSCCLRTLFPWFCNPNGPQGNVLWGNFAPFATANLITGAWATDVHSLLRPDGVNAVVRPPIETWRYFQKVDPIAGRAHPRWPEKLLAWITYQRVRIRGNRGGLFFVDRRRTYGDQLERSRKAGIEDRPQANW